MLRDGNPQMQTLDQWLFSLVKKSARGQSSFQNGSEIVFRICWQLRVAVLFVVAGCGFLLFTLMQTKATPGDPHYLLPLLSLIVGALPTAILFALPGRIVIDSSGIRQTFWWRRAKRIAWDDFASVIHDRNDGSTIVYGKFSSPIKFSSYLVDQPRFDRQVKVLSRTDEIPDDI